MTDRRIRALKSSRTEPDKSSGHRWQGAKRAHTGGTEPTSNTASGVQGLSGDVEGGSQRPIRVLIAKPGLDGHDVGAKLVARALMDAGMEVIYTGLRQSAEAIANTALQEGVDVVGLSVLSGAHLPLCRKVGEALKKRELEDLVWLVGGNVPRRDHDALKEMGVSAVFPTASSFEEMVQFIQERVPV